MSLQEEAFKQINESITIVRPQVVTAKEFLVNNFKKNKSDSAKDALHRFLLSVDAIAPVKVILHYSVDSSVFISKAIKSISWSLAFSEAIWSLIHTNVLYETDGVVFLEEPQIEWTTVVPGSGGSSAGWSFPQWKYSLPNQLIFSPAYSFITQDYLIDPDLFLKHIDIESMDSGVREALEDSINCFRAELYTPCLTMLAKGLEGVWTELGISLIMSLQVSQQDSLKKQSDVFTAEVSSIAKIIRTVLELFENQELFGQISRESKVKLVDLRNTVNWADCVRESRNVVHFGKEPTLPNDFEKVSAILLGAPKHFKLLYRIIDVCKEKIVLEE